MSRFRGAPADLICESFADVTFDDLIGLMRRLGDIALQNFGDARDFTFDNPVGAGEILTAGIPAFADFPVTFRNLLDTAFARDPDPKASPTRIYGQNFVVFMNSDSPAVGLLKPEYDNHRSKNLLERCYSLSSDDVPRRAKAYRWHGAKLSQAEMGRVLRFTSWPTGRLPRHIDIVPFGLRNGEISRAQGLAVLLEIPKAIMLHLVASGVVPPAFEARPPERKVFFTTEVMELFDAISRSMPGIKRVPHGLGNYQAITKLTNIPGRAILQEMMTGVREVKARLLSADGPSGWIGSLAASEVRGRTKQIPQDCVGTVQLRRLTGLNPATLPTAIEMGILQANRNGKSLIATRGEAMRFRADYTTVMRFSAESGIHRMQIWRFIRDEDVTCVISRRKDAIFRASDLSPLLQQPRSNDLC